MAGSDHRRKRILVIESAGTDASDGGSIASLVDAAGRGRWLVDRSDGADARDSLLKPHLRLIVIDEAAVAESERGWLLEQIHRHAPSAGVVYIARDNSPEVERSVRARGVLHYTSQPIERERLVQLLRAIVESANSQPR
jgi:DNA-binding NarL/FixJ family response regulator